MGGRSENRRDFGKVGRGSGGLRLGSTHHRVAGLKRLAEQNAALLSGKWFSKRIQDTCVPGVRGVWALRSKGRTVDLPTPIMPVAWCGGQTLRVAPLIPQLLRFKPVYNSLPGVWEGPMPCFKLTKEGKGDRMDKVMCLRLHFYVT